MRDYGKVSPQFWVGRTGKSLRGDMEAQLVAVYLMTSPHANMIGVFYCPIEYISKETGIPLEGASKALRRLEKEGFCTYEDELELVFVHSFAANQIGEELKPNDKRVQGVVNELAKVPKGQCHQAFTERYGVSYHLPTPGKKTKGHQSPIKAPSKPEAGAEAETGAEEGSAEPGGSALASGFAIPLVDGSEWKVPAQQLAEWKAAFPAADVEQELREMRVWSLANLPQRKTQRGVSAFVVRWLQKAQDTPGRAKRTEQPNLLAGAI